MAIQALTDQGLGPLGTRTPFSNNFFFNFMQFSVQNGQK